MVLLCDWWLTPRAPDRLWRMYALAFSLPGSGFVEGKSAIISAAGNASRWEENITRGCSFLRDKTGPNRLHECKINRMNRFLIQ